MHVLVAPGMANHLNLNAHHDLAFSCKQCPCTQLKDSVKCETIGLSCIKALLPDAHNWGVRNPTL